MTNEEIAAQAKMLSRDPAIAGTPTAKLAELVLGLANNAALAAHVAAKAAGNPIPPSKDFLKKQKQ